MAPSKLYVSFSKRSFELKALKVEYNIGFLVSWVAAIQGIYLSTILLLPRKRTSQRILLGVVFVSITIRIIKSLLWVSLEDLDLWIMNLGFMAHSIYGPALYLYMRGESRDKAWNSAMLLHFLPAAFLLLTLNTLTLDAFWYQSGYAVLLLHQAVYSVAALFVFLTATPRAPQANGSGTVRRNWYVLLLSGALLLQFSYFANYLLGLTPYLLGPMIYGIFLFLTSVFIFRHPSVLEPAERRRTALLSQEELPALTRKLSSYMEEAQPYLDPNCTLTTLSGELGLRPDQLSYLINTGFHQNFTSFLNAYRIEKAKSLLASRRYKHYKIAAIALECGFKSLSSFNLAFKRNTSLTPSRFRAKSLSDL